MNIWEGVLAYVVGPGVVTSGAYMSARVAAKGSVQAAEVTNDVEQEVSAVHGYHQLVTDLQSDVSRLREDHEDLRREHTDLRRHVKGLEEQASRDKSLIRHLYGYIRVLRDEILRLGGLVPDAPGDLDEHISNGKHV